MAVFSDVELEWQGQLYTIASDRMMKAIAIIEGHITVSEILLVTVGRSIPLSKLCMAYAAVLRYAGARVTDEQVYESVFDGADVQGTMSRAVEKLMTMMLPASTRARLEAEAAAEMAGEGEAEASGNSPATAPAS
jgi:hypothetical protein